MVAPVVEIPWLHERRHEVVVADVRWYLDGRSGREAYERGHLPGAVFVDLDGALSGEADESTGRHPLPDAARFARAMSRLGIGDASTVVAYDDQGGVVAARLVWMLRVTGHEAALLDGGLAAYRGELERSRPAFDPVPAPAPFTARPWPVDRLAGLEDVADARHTFLDARSVERYRGDEEPYDPRAGHIPRARSVPCRENLDEQGHFLAPERLRRRFEAAGVTVGASVISYCGSGITACHNLLALERAGLGQGRLYPGSWSQYSHAGECPVETGGDRAG